MNMPERYLTPKEISAKLSELHGLDVDERYVQRIRVESVRRRDGVFIAKRAKASEVFAWIKANPEWRPYSSRPSIGVGIVSV